MYFKMTDTRNIYTPNSNPFLLPSLKAALLFSAFSSWPICSVSLFSVFNIFVLSICIILRPWRDFITFTLCPVRDLICFSVLLVHLYSLDNPCTAGCTPILQASWVYAGSIFYYTLCVWSVVDWWAELRICLSYRTSFGVRAVFRGWVGYPKWRLGLGLRSSVFIFDRWCVYGGWCGKVVVMCGGIGRGSSGGAVGMVMWYGDAW
jgi:hypothetical protein